MKIFVTGATGFLGGRVAEQLRGRGDEITCLVRDRDRASSLIELGCRIVDGDLGDAGLLRDEIASADAVIHAAAIYEVGVPKRKRRPMWEANVVGSQNLFRSALEAGCERLVYDSTVAVFGNTAGQVVDETFERSDEGFTSFYEETKYRAHQIALDLIVGDGLKCVIAQPGAVYGPGDHSSIGRTLDQFIAGRLPALAFGDLGLTFVHVDDAAAGILACLDRGELGRPYVLGGEVGTLRDLIRTAARVLGRKPPRASIPTGAIRALKPFGPLVGAGMGQPPNLGELIDSADGVTFWASSDRARNELSYEPRSLVQGISDTLAARGLIAPR